MSKESWAVMKTIDAKLYLLCGIVAAGLVVCLPGEHRARAQADQANKTLRAQLSQMDALLADNQRLLALLPADHGQPLQSIHESDIPPPINETTKELLRLHGEAEALRQESKVIEAIREDTRQTRLAHQPDGSNSNNPWQMQTSGNNSTGSQLEIVQAVYWTDNSRMDVTDELRNRIRSDTLKTIASNNLKGDPEYGQTKRLTIEYRYGGVSITNEFREGALVVLPPETTP